MFASVICNGVENRAFLQQLVIGLPSRQINFYPSGTPYCIRLLAPSLPSTTTFKDVLWFGFYLVLQAECNAQYLSSQPLKGDQDN